MKRELRVRHLETGEVVRRIDITGKGDAHAERAMSGMLINMADDYVVEDSADDEEGA